MDFVDHWLSLDQKIGAVTKTGYFVLQRNNRAIFFVFPGNYRRMTNEPD